VEKINFEPWRKARIWFHLDGKLSSDKGVTVQVFEKEPAFRAAQRKKTTPLPFRAGEVNS
jgi:hypothetical protein